ncbi:hypothetical protein C2G38_2155703 [Gigaspora rosea]|uniref:Uncharacterized protein n=1 Tax=Gigaspora rosea TaxID=44941 RepID=A0A397W9Y3_9GLOM|nr:hypothetical protein C2G38_2155703 [Gigaspora rosea]
MAKHDKDLPTEINNDDMKAVGMLLGDFTTGSWNKNIKIANNSTLNIPFRLHMSVITKIYDYDFVLSIVNKPSNPLQHGFLCSVGKKFGDIQDTPLATINLVYQEVIGSRTKTKHSGLAVLGFYNEEIVLEMINDIPFFLLYVEVDKCSILITKIRYSSQQDLSYAGPGYTSSLITCHGSETYHILQQILEDH